MLPVLWLLGCNPLDYTKNAHQGLPGAYGDTGGPQGHDTADTSTPPKDTGPQDGTGGNGPPPAKDTSSASPSGLQACYLGADGSGGTCLDLSDVTGMSSDYDYPAPYGGSAQYRAPVRWLDLSTLPPTLKIAPNFALDECAQADKGRYGVLEPASIAHLQNMRDVIGAIQVTSGYRSPGHNAAIGGVTYSRHMYGDGFDLVGLSVSLDATASACQDEGAAYVGWYTDHIHCDWRNDTLDTGFYGSAMVDVRARPLWDPEEGPPLREWHR